MEDNKTKIEFTNTFIKLFNYERDNKITLKEFMTEIWEWHISNQVEKPVMPKIVDFMAFFRRTEKDLIDKVGFITWQNEKTYFTTEINEFVAKWIDNNFSA